MRSSRLFNWAVLLSLAMCLIIASSWFGAILYVRHYPNIVEYIDTPQVETPEGLPVQDAHAGDWVSLKIKVRRQPFHCWGVITYIINGPVTYQFPNLRQSGLGTDVQEAQFRLLMKIPDGLPAGDYRWSVVVYPTCDGVEVSPLTIDLGVATHIISLHEKR